MNGPKLPSRDRKNGRAGQTTQPSQLQPLQQQLHSNPVFRQFVDQPEKLLSVLQQDPVLAGAAANSPDIAALLDPSTLKQALAALQGGSDGSQHEQQQSQQQGPLPGVQRKALMQLQNYAMQLQQARATGGTGPAVLPAQMGAQPTPAAAGNQHEEGMPAVGGVADGSMWAALQQRLNKLQQRSSLLGAAAAGAAGHGNPSSLSPMQQQLQLPTPWMSAQMQQQQQQQQHLEQQQQQQHQQELPIQDPQQAAMQQHGRQRRDAASRGLLPQGSSGSMGSPAASPRVARLSRLAMPEGHGQGSSVGSGRVMSPLGMGASPSGSAGLGTSSSAHLSPGSMAALQRRSSSSLSHRLLRHTAASPLDLTADLQRSGSQALNVEQLESGDLIVDITPPTRVTQELSWSTDPTAAYVLDAGSPGSFSQLPPSDSTTHLPVSTLAAAASIPSNSSMHPAGAAESSAASAGIGEPHTWDSSGSQQPRAQLYALPLLGGSSEPQAISMQAATAGASGSSQGYASQVAAAASAAAGAANAGAASGRRSSSSNRQRASPQKLALRVAKQEQQGSRVQQQPQPHQQPQEDHYSYVDLSDPAEQTAALASKQAMQQQFQQQLQQQQQCQHHQQQQQQQQQYDSAAGTALAGARAAAAAGGSLDARTYYEPVAPSTWRPTDVGSAPGDYLELYRRAYCSYADALFPPLWMGLLGTLAALQLLPLWQICLLGLLTFWGGLWLMAIKWAGVPASQLGLSRVTPMLTVCLELVCTGAFLTQVLPVMWLGHSLLCMVLLVTSCSTLALHLTAYLQDPGYTPLPDAEEGTYAGGQSGSATSSSKHGTGGPTTSGQPAGAASSDAASESTPLLPSQQQPQQPPHSQAGSGAGGSAWAGQPMDHCWTCMVKRNLRSKHCPLCKRCVERFDHHCPVLGNCVGAGNHKTFVAFLALMLLSQLLFCQLTTSMLTQTYLLQLSAPLYNSPVGAAHTAATLGGSGSSGLQAAPRTATGGLGAAGAASGVAAGGAAAGQSSSSSTAAGAPGPEVALQQGQDSAAGGAGRAAGGAAGSHQGWWFALQALWASGSTHTGLVLLLLAQLPTMFMSGFLLLRALGLAAANLTVNEWLNRQRYVHLHYTGAGFSNRFDRGVGANCYDFWCGPKFVDYWQAWEAGEQEMQRKGMTVLVPWSPTVLVRFWDLRWSQYQQRLMSSRERRKELQMQRRMLALGLPTNS